MKKMLKLNVQHHALQKSSVLNMNTDNDPKGKVTPRRLQKRVRNLPALCQVIMILNIVARVQYKEIESLRPRGRRSGAQF